MTESKPTNAAAPCRNLWRNVSHSNLQKCECCGAVRVDPKARQAEHQESAQMNRSAA